MNRLTVLLLCVALFPNIGLAREDLPILSRAPFYSVPAQPQFMLNQILVQFREDATTQEVAAFTNSVGATIHEVGRNLGFRVVEFPLQQAPEVAKVAYAARDLETCEKMIADAREHVWEMIAAFQASGLVEWARPNHIVHVAMTPNDPYYRWPTGWPNSSEPDQYGVIQMNPEDGWEVTTGDGVVIVLTDSGLDLDHPDIVANVWTNPGEIAGNGIDDEGNGYVDDVHGYDFCGDWNGDLWGSPNEDPDPDIRAGDPSCGDGEDNNLDGYADYGVGHGTMTSGCAACVVNNGTSYAGVAGSAKVAMARCMSPEGTGTEAMIAAAFEYARFAPADVISSSLGGSSAMSSVHAQIQLAYNAGIPSFVASGNAGTNSPMYPAYYPECCAVGGVKHDDSGRTSITSYGDWLDCCAASGDVVGSSLTEAVWSIYVASVADANSDPGLNPGDPMLAGAAGTSLAAPLVAGLGALIRSVAPTYTASQIYSQIYDHCYDVPPSGFDIQTGYGRVDVSAALADWSLVSVGEMPAGKGVALRSLPNPSGGEVVFQLALSAGVPVRSVEIYDVAGRLLRRLDATDSHGRLRWDGTDAAGVGVGAGVYLYRVRYADDSVSPAQKLVRIR
jgi:subtilisin family serine protease